METTPTPIPVFNELGIEQISFVSLLDNIEIILIAVVSTILLFLAVKAMFSFFKHMLGYKSELDY